MKIGVGSRVAVYVAASSGTEAGVLDPTALFWGTAVLLKASDEVNVEIHTEDEVDTILKVDVDRANS